MKTLILALIAGEAMSRADAELMVGEALTEERAQAKADARAAVDAELTQLKTDKEAVEGQRDALQTQLDAAPDVTPTADADLLAYANDRAAVLARADELGISLDGADEIAGIADLKAAVCKAHLGDRFKADASEAYIDAAWDFMGATPVAREDAPKHALRLVDPKVREDADEPAPTPGDTWRTNIQKEA